MILIHQYRESYNKNLIEGGDYVVRKALRCATKVEMRAMIERDEIKLSSLIKEINGDTFLELCLHSEFAKEIQERGLSWVIPYYQ